MLKGKKILLGVTGSIAAYKSAMLVRLLVKQEAEVRVILTPSARDFVTPLTLATLSRNPVLSEFQQSQTGTWNNHVELGLWADAFIIAPASANTVAKLAHGLCDNLLLATYLSARCPVFLAPAMDLDMLAHPATQKNLSTLQAHGHRLIKTNFGELASGLTGDGRMAEPEEIVESLRQHFDSKKKLTGKRALVTAGPTYEALDPVRFISNHSSGKMGFAIAEALAEEGATVDLVSGPTTQQTHLPGITTHAVVSADDMAAACSRLFPSADITVLSAAVADYKPAVRADQKIKKTSDSLTLELTRTPDIAARLGEQKRPGQLLVGFALETENEVSNARKKLEAKNFDFIVLNSLNDSGAGFGGDTNQVRILHRTGDPAVFPLKPKREVARDIVQAILNHHA
ncbi:MAG: bifunctional phosphopantothenoylcysteine decarboxylase/phosphopantothenate--cysteine ligase CoaBC [Cyclobacteriaceae bacterium]|nr:bifunctional phosphopantothenoylcysteine decarboxylase/phosphopantothenate--cysteine ligase CoaBC [Cyclobacteriaceae bacterium]